MCPALAATWSRKRSHCGVGELLDVHDGVVLVLGDGRQPAGADGDGADLAGLGVGAAPLQQDLVEGGVLQRLDPGPAPPGGGEAGAGALAGGSAGNPRAAFIVSSSEGGEFGVGQLGEGRLAGAEHGVGQGALGVEHLGDAVLDRALGDQPVDLHGPGLADAVRAVGGLVLDGRVPPAVVVDDVVGAGEVQAGAGRLQRQQEDRDLAGLEAVDHLLALGDRGAAVQELGRGRRGRRGARSSSRAMRDVLGEDQHRRRPRRGWCRAARRAARACRSGRRSRGAASLQVLRRVVADLLERGQQLERPGRAGRCPRRPRSGRRISRTTASYSAPARVVSGTGVVGLGLGRQLGRDAGVGLAAAQQERPDQPGQPLGRRRVVAALDGLARQRGGTCVSGPSSPGVVQSRMRPQLGQVVLHRGAGQRDPGGAPGSCAAPWRCRSSGFLTCWASSATTRPQRLLGQASRRRSASCRRW